ncbi:MAG: type II toxin-antitoxin system TacA family antitoxin, partial [Planctomycetota bacterium]
MASDRSTQKARLDFRLRADHKALIEQAASVQGQTVTDFGVANLVKAAHETIQQAT